MRINPEKHPIDTLIRMDSTASIWCQGCGIGVVLNAFVQAVKRANLNSDKICLLSTGIGCTGKIAEYLKFKSFNIADCNVVDYAIELKLQEPELKIVTFLNDADFIANGVDDFIEAFKKKKDIELILIYFNSYLYHIFMEHKGIRQTRFSANSSANEILTPFNIPHLAKICGAKYVARWTPLHPRRLMYSINDAFNKHGFSMIEVVSPCLMYYMCEGKIREAINRMELYANSNSIIKHNEPTENLDLRENKEIIIGKFVDKE